MLAADWHAEIVGNTSSSVSPFGNLCCLTLEISKLRPTEEKIFVISHVVLEYLQFFLLSYPCLFIYQAVWSQLHMMSIRSFLSIVGKQHSSVFSGFFKNNEDNKL